MPPPILFSSHMPPAAMSLFTFMPTVTAIAVTTSTALHTAISVAICPASASSLAMPPSPSAPAREPPGHTNTRHGREPRVPRCLRLAGFPPSRSLPWLGTYDITSRMHMQQPDRCMT